MTIVPQGSRWLTASVLAALCCWSAPASAGESEAAIVLAQRMDRPSFNVRPTRVPTGPSGGIDRPPRPRPPHGGPRPPRPHRWPYPSGPGIVIGPPPIDIYPPPPALVEEAPPPRRKVVRPQKPASSGGNKARRPATPARAAPPPPPPAAVVADTYIRDEVVFELRADVAQSEGDAVLRRFNLTAIDRSSIDLLGSTLIRARIPRGRTVPAVVRALSADPRVASAQPNHLFTLQEAASASEANGDMAAAQYALASLNVKEAHDIARGASVLVAIIDSGIDTAHPELDRSFDQATVSREPTLHGTGIAGVIASHRRLIGMAPDVRVLGIDAFKTEGETGKGATLDILNGLDRAAKQGAKVVNLSFAGPRDALLSRALRAASLRGLVLVAAVGNAGPKAKPLFPAAHPDVIGVTAVDAQDRIYKAAGAGAHVAVAAPGVDILSPAVDGAYQQPSGTSFAAAHVSGIAALLLQIDPDLTPEDVRRVLTETAQDLGPKGRDDTFGAGRVSALAALQAVVKSREIRAATKAELTD